MKERGIRRIKQELGNNETRGGQDRKGEKRGTVRGDRRVQEWKEEKYVD